MTRTEILADAILSASRSPKAITHSHLSAFLGVKGSRYDRELMVVGRAVNGWDEFEPAKMVDDSSALEIARGAYKNGEKCPLGWVCDMWGATEDYDTSRSAYWRTVRQVLAVLVPDSTADERWSSRLAWSNLAKLSGRKGNPPEWLWKGQVDACRRILRAEIGEFAPKRILLSTGWDWAKWFLDDSIRPESITMTGDKLCQAHGRLGADLGSSAFVVAAHPQGKDESDWVAEVLDGFRRTERL